MKKAATVWADPEGQVDTERVLRTHSKWNYFAISKMSGHTFYNLGGQQWIDGKLVKK
ncbi:MULTISPECIES: hypothetical protein [Lactobacillus]|uniref:hypothetical protein n=1 Tax=Lactobacillus TaxID=1578 RepID=UPI0013747D83|nr:MULTISPECIES: hypothetical protein [Lactobacillus]